MIYGIEQFEAQKLKKNFSEKSVSMVAKCR